MKKIVVVGGTGFLGNPVVNELAKNNFEVFVPSRTRAEKSQASKNVSYVQADIANVESMSSLLKGAHGLHINLSGEAELNAEHLVSLAKKSGTQLITYISGITVNKENLTLASIKGKYNLEKAIVSSGINYVVFKPTWFMESLPLFINSGRASYFGKQLKSIPFASAVDYTRMVSGAYLNQLNYNQSYAVVGPESFTFEEALKIYVEKKEPSITKVTSTPYFIGNIIALVSRNKSVKQTVAFMKYFETAKIPDYDSDLILTGETSIYKWLAGLQKSN
jgi:uncharacterized protein YbjT (DUF2867 family)